MNEEIITTKTVSSDLYAETSSLSFIFRIPTETLEDIFIQQTRDYHGENGSHPTPTLPSWVNVSYVCRHWRNVALNCATLWTYLFIMSPRWTEELLARSKKAPLKLHVDPHHGHGSEAPCVVGQVMNHVERIQELRLSLSLLGWENQLYSKLSSPAPNLQCLRICAPNASPEWVLPSVLFDGDTPALRTLELSCCPVAWYSLKLSRLTALSLFHIPPRLQQNTEELLATLRCMQDLTQLYLHRALASAAGFLSSTVFHTFQKFNLPHLSRLYLAAPLSTIVAMLSCVNIPLKTEIRLESPSEHGSSLGDYAALCSLLAQRYNTSGDQAPFIPTIRSLVFNIWSGAMALTFSALEHDDFAFSVPPSKWGCGIPLQTRLNFDESMPASITDRIISDVCCSLPLTNVETVRVIEPPVSSTFWRKILGHLPNLRYLKLSEGRMPDLASVLSLTHHGDTEKEGGYTDRGPGRVLAPILEELELEDIDFFSSSLPEGLTMDPPTADVQSLIGALSSREESQGRLCVAYCQVYKDNCIDAKLDMVGRWENGQFHVVEERLRPYRRDPLDWDPTAY
ncbi:hypothetical protein OG21DRAFT_1496349 [Imleria badia]|nr:hypothetical protein OG21DRAFT_1496349 [Imleria badia]